MSSRQSGRELGVVLHEFEDGRTVRADDRVARGVFPADHQRRSARWTGPQRTAVIRVGMHVLEESSAPELDESRRQNVVELRARVLAEYGQCAIHRHAGTEGTMTCHGIEGVADADNARRQLSRQPRVFKRDIPVRPGAHGAGGPCL